MAATRSNLRRHVALITARLAAPLVLLALLAPSPANAQAADADDVDIEVLEPYDAANIPYAPSSVAFATCGFSIGLDPRWTLKTKSEGAKVDVISSYDLEAAQKLDTHPFAKLSLTPHSYIHVICRPASAEETNTRSSAERAVKNAVKRGTIGKPDVAPARIGAAGDWLRIAYRQPGDDGRAYSRVTYVSQRDGILRQVFIRMPQDPPSEKMKRTFKAGQSASFTQKDGPTISAPMKRTTGAAASGLLYPMRSHAENIALAEQVAATIR